MPNAQCPMHNAQCPIVSIVTKKGYTSTIVDKILQISIFNKV
jgi:hypothetical protein